MVSQTRREEELEELKRQKVYYGCLHEVCKRHGHIQGIESGGWELHQCARSY